MSEIEKLALLSQKATQGEWSAIVRTSTPLAHVVSGTKPVADIYGGADTTQEERFANAHLSAALVNWFRANHQSLESVRSEARATADYAMGLEDAAQLLDAASGRHFAAIGTSDDERDKHRHGIKAAMAMEVAAAIRTLSTARVAEGEDVHSTELRK